MAGESPRSSKRAGRYELLFDLARGGMGIVYVAKLIGAHGFDRLVAIKVLSAPDVGQGALDEFLTEARVTSGIHHPNVVQTLELFEDEGTPYIVMELVQGVSLAKLLSRLSKEKKSLDVDLAAWIVLQVASGLHAAHELTDDDGNPMSLVHRDISPQNVLLSFDGRVCLADFGVAKFRKEGLSTQTGVVKGKFPYMAPEQARGLPLDRRSDLFSLGIVLHEALCGKRLFSGDAPGEVVLKIIDTDAPDPRVSRSDVPETLAWIVMQCLKRDREERFDSADAVAQALRGFLQQLSVRTDEHRLATLLREVFADDRERFKKALKGTATEPEERSTEPSPTPSFDKPDSVETHLTAEVAGVPRRGLLLPLLGVVGAAALAVGGIFALTRHPTDPAPAGTASITPPSATAPVTTRIAPAAMSAPPVVATDAGKITTPIRTARPTAALSASAPPLPPPSSSSRVGLPFESL